VSWDFRRSLEQEAESKSNLVSLIGINRALKPALPMASLFRANLRLSILAAAKPVVIYCKFGKYWRSPGRDFQGFSAFV